MYVPTSVPELACMLVKYLLPFYTDWMALRSRTELPCHFRWARAMMPSVEEQEEKEEDVESDSDDNTLPQHVSLCHTADNDRGRLLCWGNGEFGQTGRGRTSDVSCQRGLLEQYATSEHGARVKIVACGSSHTVIVTGKLMLLSRQDIFLMSAQSMAFKRLCIMKWL